MSDSDIQRLVERIEGASGPDREIDALIYHDLLGFCRHARKVKTGAQSDTGFDCLDCGADSWGNKSRKGGYPAGQGLHDSAPRYTASIDAAMTLVGDDFFRIERHPMYGVYAFVGDDDAYAETPALAITLAALRARITERTDDE